MQTKLPSTFTGTIVSGSCQASKLGYPTANLDVQPEDTIAHGVYSGIASCESFFTNALCVIFYGKPYSLERDADIRFEVHIIDRQLPALYGKPMTMTLLRYIRPNRKFESIDALSQAIRQDIDICKLAPVS